MPRSHGLLGVEIRLELLRDPQLIARQELRGLLESRPATLALSARSYTLYRRLYRPERTCLATLGSRSTSASRLDWNVVAAQNFKTGQAS